MIEAQTHTYTQESGLPEQEGRGLGAGDGAWSLCLGAGAGGRGAWRGLDVRISQALTGY